MDQIRNRYKTQTCTGLPRGKKSVGCVQMDNYQVVRVNNIPLRIDELNAAVTTRMATAQTTQTSSTRTPPPIYRFAANAVNFNLRHRFHQPDKSDEELRVGVDVRVAELPGDGDVFQQQRLRDLGQRPIAARVAASATSKPTSMRRWPALTNRCRTPAAAPTTRARRRRKCCSSSPTAPPTK